MILAILILIVLAIGSVYAFLNDRREYKAMVFDQEMGVECRCGHSRFYHFGFRAYCRGHEYDRTGHEPECGCGVFTAARVWEDTP